MTAQVTDEADADDCSDVDAVVIGAGSSELPMLRTLRDEMGRSATVLSHMPVSIEQHVELVGRAIQDLETRRATTMEATVEAENAWCEHNQAAAEATPFPTADTRAEVVA